MDDEEEVEREKHGEGSWKRNISLSQEDALNR